MTLPTTQRLRSGADIWTFQDIVEHILDVFDNSRSGRPLRMARRAAREALRELHMSHRWSYYNISHFFRTKAQQTAGTIEYIHAGTGTGTGSEARSVVLSGATWPSDVVDYKIIIDGTHYAIESRVDDDEITLPENENPGADVDAGTSYTLYKQTYSLPIGIAEMGMLVDLDNNRQVPIIASDARVARKYFSRDTPDTPWHVSFGGGPVYLNDLSVTFVPPPNSERDYRLTYQRQPKMLETEIYSTGTATVASGSTSVTFGGEASLTDRHVGSVIRFGSSTQDPTPVPGAIDGTDNPFTDQAVILSQDGDSCTLDTAVNKAYSGVKYSISDPVDIEIGSHLTAFQRLCEATYADLTKRALDERQTLRDEAHRALIMAMERDNKTIYSATYAPYDPFSYVDVETDDG